MSGEFGFDEFVDYLTFIFKERSDLASVGSVNFFQVWVNMAYRQMTTRNRFWGLRKNFYFPELEVVDTSLTTTDGTATLTTPTDTLVIRHCFDETNNRYIEPITWERYLRYEDRDDTSAEGEPDEWVRSETKIYLHPTPDTTGDSIYVYYRKIPAELTTTGKTVIDAAWDEPIIHLAAYKGFMYLGEYDKALKHKEEFLELVSSLIGTYDSEQRAANVIAKPHPFMTAGFFKGR
ncbi:MAG: hypothetical protein V3V81_08085 [Candidatus Bathyarchaeia archaeon]